MDGILVVVDYFWLGERLKSLPRNLNSHGICLIVVNLCLNIYPCKFETKRIKVAGYFLDIIFTSDFTQSKEFKWYSKEILKSSVKYLFVLLLYQNIKDFIFASTF